MRSDDEPSAAGRGIPSGMRSAMRSAVRRAMIDRLRQEVSRRIFRGRVRLGEGAGLERIRPEDLAEIQRRFPMRKFFILGHARSGTSFLGRLIRVHPRVHCEWQTQFFSDRGPIPYFTAPSFLHWLRHPSNKWVADWDPTPSLLRVCLDTILEREARRLNKDIVGDKSPNENGDQAVRWLSAVYPDGHLIYIVRDGRDTVLSKRIQAFIDQPDTLGRKDRQVRRALLEDPKPFLGGRRSIFTPDGLEEAARGWAEKVSSSVAAGRELFADHFVTVRYEDLLADAFLHLRKLWVWLGADGGDPALESAVHRQLRENPEAEWHEAAGSDIVRGLPRGIHGGWQQVFTSSDAERFDSVARATLEAFGYV